MTGIRFPASSEMGDLTHDSRAVLANPFRELLQIRNYFVIANIKLLEDRR